MQRLRERAEHRITLAGGPGGAERPEDAEPPAVIYIYSRLRSQMLDAARERIIEMRDEGQLGHEVFLQVQRELDLEESSLRRS